MKEHRQQPVFHACKIRQLISDLNRAGFELDRQKGSHRQFKHQAFPGIITLSGADGDDAQRYQEKQIAQAIAQAFKK